MCLVYTPVAINLAPSLIIAASTRSPSRSTNVTLLTSTTHLRLPFGQRDLSQFDFSCATHGPESRPCSVQRCSVRSSVIVILSTALSCLQMEIAHGVPFSDSRMNFLKVDGIRGDKSRNKISSREMCQRATARFMAVCHFRGIRKNCESICRK